jgi:Leucine-rich repeat (LRR) protein
MKQFLPGKNSFRLLLIFFIFSIVAIDVFSQKNENLNSSNDNNKMNSEILVKKKKTSGAIKTPNVPVNADPNEVEKVYSENDLINEKDLSKVRNVALINLNDKIPAQLFDCKNIKILALGGNIPFLPEEIGELTSLRVLKINYLSNIVTLPNSLKNLTNLTEIDVSLPMGFDVFPDIFGHLNSLKKLKINGNFIYLPNSLFEIDSLEDLEISVGISRQPVERIGKMKNLKRISLPEGIQNIPESWSSLGKLEELTIKLLNYEEVKDNFHFFSKLKKLKIILPNYPKSNLTKFPGSIWTLKNLISLEIHNSIFIDNGNVASELPNLKKITFYHGEIGELNSSIRNWTGITDLEILDLKIKTIADELGYLKELRNLTINGNKIVKLPDFSNLTKLENFTVIRNSLEALPTGLKNLKNLQTLHAASNNIKYFDKDIYLLPNLQTLSLSNNKIQILPNIDKNELNSLQTLEMYHNEIRDIHFDFNGMNKLEHIDFSENNLTEIPRGIFNLKFLGTLIIKENKISNIPKDMSKLKSLHFLSLAHNEIKEGLKNLENLEDLMVINLSFNKIDTQNLNYEKLISLNALNLSQNKITSLADHNFEKSKLGKYEFPSGDGINLSGNPIDTISKSQVEWLKKRNYANSQEIYEIISQN